MPGSVTTIEAKRQPVVSPATDFAVCVVGFTSATPLPTGQVSAFYSSPAALYDDYRIGDAVDTALQAIVKTDGNPRPPPIAICPTPATTPGSYGSLDTSLVTGSAVVTTHTGSHPRLTAQARVQVLDDGNNGAGGLIGSAGIVLRACLDGGGAVAKGGGPTWLPSVQLGTALTFSILLADGTDTGIEFDLAPATTNAAYVTLAVELQADTLAHLASAVFHDGADTSAAQIALAAASVPATVSASTAVVNLVLAALISHVVNITSVHEGPDLVARNALAALVAAVGTKTGIDLAIALNGILNTHEAAALAASATGLMGSTTSSASPQTYTAAANFAAGGVALMDAQPRRVEIVISGGGTPGDMADTVTITGFDYAGNAQTETALDLTGLGTVLSAKAWKGTGLQLAFIAGAGTGATFTVGYDKGVHESADGTNTITSPDPTYGTLKTGDEWSVPTTPPMWADADLYTAGAPATGAFAAIGQSSSTFGMIVLSEPIAAGDFATLVAALDYGATLGKRWALLTRFRDPTAGESDAAYVAALRVFAAAHHDDRIAIVAGSGWLTDAFRGWRPLRTGLPAILARLAGNSVIPGAKGERLTQHPGYVARGPLEKFSVVDDAGNLVGHDEKQLAGIDGPIAGCGGGITFFQIPAGGELPGTYVSEADVLYPAVSNALTIMDRRLLDGVERVANASLWTAIQGAAIVDKTAVPPVLDDASADAIGGAAGKRIRDAYASEFANSGDIDLVKIDSEVTISGAKIQVTGTATLEPYLYVHDIILTISAER